MKFGPLLRMTVLAVAAIPAGLTIFAQGNAPSRLAGPFSWELSPPLILPQNKRAVEPERAVKDPSIVYDGGKWHVFMSYKCQGHTAMEYVGFDKWENADKSLRTVLRVCDSKYYGAPQVFYFRPQKKWYLVYQMGVPGLKKLWVAYSTTTNIADPTSWTKAQPMLDGSDRDPRKEGGLDYWIICDDQRAYLFYANDNGKLWRLWTPIKDFPNGFDHPELALNGDIYEAGDIYRLKGTNQYLAIIEARGPGDIRYYAAYVADRLDGKWTGLANTQTNPFAGAANVTAAAGGTLWTDNISHGELIRDSNDETLTVDPGKLQFLIMGVLQKDKPKSYQQIPWRIGLLTLKKTT
jgi:hypothetical protein